jgi:hypothetical protein
MGGGEIKLAGVAAGLWKQQETARNDGEMQKARPRVVEHPSTAQTRQPPVCQLLIDKAVVFPRIQKHKHPGGLTISINSTKLHMI